MKFGKAFLIEGLWVAIVLAIFSLAVQSYFQDQFRRDFSYVLSNHLGSVQGVIKKDPGLIVQGVHVNDKNVITYPSLPSWLNVSLKADKFSNRSDARILLHPFPGSKHELEWNNVPRGKNLRLKYGFSDSALNHKPAEKMGVVLEVFNGSGSPIYSATLICEQRLECPKGLQSADILNPFESVLDSLESTTSLRLSVSPISDSVNYHWFYVDGYIW